MKKILSMILCLAMVLSFGAVALADGDIVVKVGVEEPLTGANAALGTAEFNAIEMCIEMLNEKGGVAGKYPIEYV